MFGQNRTVTIRNITVFGNALVLIIYLAVLIILQTQRNYVLLDANVNNLFSLLLGAPANRILTLFGATPFHILGFRLLAPIFIIFSPIGIIIGLSLSTILLYLRYSAYFLIGLFALLWITVSFATSPFNFILLWVFWFIGSFFYLSHKKDFRQAVPDHIKLFLFGPLVSVILGLIFAIYLAIAVILSGIIDATLFQLSLPSIITLTARGNTQKQFIIGTYNRQTHEYFVVSPDEKPQYFLYSQKLVRLVPASPSPTPHR